MSIGQRSDGTFTFDGLIDEVSIYNRAYGCRNSGYFSGWQQRKMQTMILHALSFIPA